MYNIIKQLTVGMIVLLIMPIGVWLSGWTWQPNGNSDLLKVLFTITETAGAPWAILTCLVLTLVFIWCLKKNAKQSLKLVGLLIVVVFVSQGIKSVIKSALEEPRPFVAWMEEQYKIDDEYFYSLPRSERAALIGEKLRHSENVPSWLYKYWKRETGYSFPSGHTLFAACWALLAVGFLWRQRCYIVVTGLMLWEIVIAVSRLILGMHWTIDLIVSTVLAWIIAIIACYFAKVYSIIDFEER